MKQNGSMSEKGKKYGCRGTRTVRKIGEALDDN